MKASPGVSSRRRLFTSLILLPSIGIVTSSFAFAEKPPTRSVIKAPIHIEVQDAQGSRLAGSNTHSPSSNSVTTFTIDRVYQPGYRILLNGPHDIAAKLDDTMPECLLYLPNASPAGFSYEIPYGREEKQTGSAYAPEAFSEKSHHITVRTLTPAERTAYRNLALNPCDQLQPEDGPAMAYPHSTTNSYSRNLYDFAARNAIDGKVQNGHHGVWPYQSWGPGLRSDLWWKVDFGRMVELDKLRLMVRADFPHDSYWKSALIEFSDGSLFPITLTDSPELQEFPFPKRNVSWMRIVNLVSADPAKWCSFIEVETWGRNLP